MRPICVIGCAAVLSLACFGCSHDNQQQPPPTTAAQQPSPAPTVQEHARALLLAADVQLRDLKDVRSRTLDNDKRDAVSEQIADVRMYRDRLAADLGASPLDRRAIQLDMKGLNEAMHEPSTGVTEPQAPNPRGDQQR